MLPEMLPPSRTHLFRLFSLGCLLPLLAQTGCRRAAIAPDPGQEANPQAARRAAHSLAGPGESAGTKSSLLGAPADAGLPRRPSPPPPVLPAGLVSLQVAGHRPAIFVSPSRRDAPPWPVVLILHGNFDRPEWECEWWARGASPWGWLLCPRGIPRTDVSRSHDRWTYSGAQAAIREAHEALDAMSARFPKLIREDGALYVGFSLGAIIGAPVMLGCRLGFTAAAFVEGGDSIELSQMRALGRRGLARVAYLCGQHTGCSSRVRGARGALGRWERAGVKARAWVMAGAGHGYSNDFDPLGKEVVEWLGAK
ncbi:MAG: hypothetical protein RBU30_16705 [Polyangia bacterium]|nr:hypothetical protein [Polyangia bacterium]